MDEHEQTSNAIKHLTEVELPQWMKRRKELELIIEKAKAIKAQKTEVN